MSGSDQVEQVARTKSGINAFSSFGSVYVRRSVKTIIQDYSVGNSLRRIYDNMDREIEKIF